MPPNKQSALKATGFILAAAALAQAMVRRRRQFSYDGKVALVTGGSRGLGLVLARALVKAGAKVAICARNEAEVRIAVAQLQDLGGDVMGFPCDIRDEQGVQEGIDRVLGHWQRIDVVFNVAGIIEVGPIEAMTMADFENAMQTNAWGALRTSFAVIPIMRKQGWGRIVNVASLGGKRAVPHMLPYTASKFALVGLSSGLRMELAKYGIIVTTVCPGLMRTGSARHATFKGQHQKEYAWFAISDSLPFLSMPAEKAARQIMQACQRGQAEVNISGLGQIAATLQQLAPNVTTELLTLVNRLLPAAGANGKTAAKGFESTSWLAPSLLTNLGDQAAARNNEVTPL